jgi:ferrous iron transport protein A
MTSLTRIPRGAWAIVSELPKTHGLAKRLCALGLTPGSEVCVLQNRGRGPLIVEVHGARLALGRGQADRVTVQPFEAPECGEESANGDSPVVVGAVEDATAVDAPAER